MHCGRTSNSHTPDGYQLKQVLQQRRPDVELKFLGSGHESALFTDLEFVYKVFFRNDIDLSSLFSQLLDRFQGCKRLIPLIDCFYVSEHFVVKYRYEDSEAYHSGKKDEVIEFLIECRERNIVCWDVKPSNFRLFSSGLKLVDYGHDIKPFNWKDFLFMVQRAYLMVHYGDRPNFKSLARTALSHWNLDELEGFQGFFNEVYARIRDEIDVQAIQHPIDRVNNRTIFSRINSMVQDITIDTALIVTNVPLDPLSVPWSDHQILSIDTFLNEGLQWNQDIVILYLMGEEEDSFKAVLSQARQTIPVGNYCLTIIENPFFNHSHLKDPISSLHHKIFSAGFTIQSMEDSGWYPDSDGSYHSPHLLFLLKRYDGCGDDVSLVIKICYQDGPHLDVLIRHIVRQLEGPDRFLERLVILDSKDDGFLRQFGPPEKELTHDTLTSLKDDGVIDDYVITPQDPIIVRELNRRWFDIDTVNTHCRRGVPVFPQLYGFERTRGDFILQLDSDAIIVRRDRDHSYLGDMKADLDAQTSALSVSFNIAHAPDSQRRNFTSPGGGAFVPEVRICLMHKERLFQQRPFPNRIVNGDIDLTWYRSVAKAQKDRNLTSLRGGDPRTFYIHPQNDRKTNIQQWFHTIQRAEQCFIPEAQFEQVDLSGDRDDWRIPKRSEPFIFIVCGRNVPNKKFLRCWQSIVGQTQSDWGAIIIDDASDTSLPEFIRFLIRPYREKITFLRMRGRRGVLPNIYEAIHSYCTNPYSVIIILDADDMLLSFHTLQNIHEEYLKGADMTIGSMFRLRKGIPPFIPNFAEPRNKRGGDVWMHLRTFRKYLFDAIHPGDFKIKEQWVDKFTELTYMVPIAEMAEHPFFFKWPVYLYEPTQPRDQDHYRRNAQTIQHVLSCHSYSTTPRVSSTHIRPPGEFNRELGIGRKIIILRHAEKTQDIDDEKIQVTGRGKRDCRILGEAIPIQIDLIMASPSRRTVETAELIKSANSSGCPILTFPGFRGVASYDWKAWNKMKEKYGWDLLTEKWLKGEVDPSIRKPYREFAQEAISYIIDQVQTHDAQTTLIVTHDHVVALFAYHFFQELNPKVRYLHGLVIDHEALSERGELPC